ncbi:MAG: hypothetical protein AAGH79_14335 [Bacteroidota bacterium]
MLPQPIWCVLVYLTITPLWLRAQDVLPIPYGHAHNDYQHSRPLEEALEAGFTSIEVDLYYLKGTFYVSHHRPLVRQKENTLEHLYLRPLQTKLQESGAIYPGYRQPLFLMLDLKNGEKGMYEALKEVILPYQNLFRRFEGEFEIPAPMILLVSGNRPVKSILSDSLRLLRLDGRPSDLGKGIPSSWMPLISDQYRNHSSWKGRRSIPESEQVQIAALIYQTHQEGKMLRFWALPANTKVWATYLKMGLDWINTDDLTGLREFHRQQLESP